MSKESIELDSGERQAVLLVGGPSDGERIYVLTSWLSNWSKSAQFMVPVDREEGNGGGIAEYVRDVADADPIIYRYRETRRPL